MADFLLALSGLIFGLGIAVGVAALLTCFIVILFTPEESNAERL